MFNKNEMIGAGLVLGFVATIGYAVKVTNDLRKVELKLDRTVDEIKKSDIDISEDLIKKVVEKAAEEEAKYQVSRTMENAAHEVIEKYREDIRTAVDNEFNKQRSNVEKVMKEKIEDIDIREIRREVVREAKEECAKKLKKDLNDISDKYTEQIESMSNIYSTIASKIESIGE